jgi:hypothetical protein
MSRTEKDMPVEIRAYHHPHRRIEHGFDCEFGDWGRGRECDFDPNRPRQGYRSNSCGWALPYQTVREWFSDGPPAWFTKHVWQAPARGEERARLTDAIKDYRANGETDDPTFEHVQHRHGASWLWY